MRRIHGLMLMVMLVLVSGCGSTNVHFIQTNDSFVPAEKPPGAEVVFRPGKIERPHTVVGVITAELGKKARRPELDALLVQKAREIGADGVMLVQYDIDRDVYLKRHHAVVGRGPRRHHVVGTHKRVAVKKTASGIAVVFK